MAGSGHLFEEDGVGVHGIRGGVRSDGIPARPHELHDVHVACGPAKPICLMVPCQSCAHFLARSMPPKRERASRTFCQNGKGVNSGKAGNSKSSSPTPKAVEGVAHSQLRFLFMPCRLLHFLHRKGTPRMLKPLVITLTCDTLS